MPGLLVPSSTKNGVTYFTEPFAIHIGILSTSDEVVAADPVLTPHLFVVERQHHRSLIHTNIPMRTDCDGMPSPVALLNPSFGAPLH